MASRTGGEPTSWPSPIAHLAVYRTNKHGSGPGGPLPLVGGVREPYGSVNSCVCGLRCGSRIAPAVTESLRRKTFRPFVISDS